jgi:hypothetical protein
VSLSPALTVPVIAGVAAVKVPAATLAVTAETAAPGAVLGRAARPGAAVAGGGRPDAPARLQPTRSRLSTVDAFCGAPVARITVIR